MKSYRHAMGDIKRNLSYIEPSERAYAVAELVEMLSPADKNILNGIIYSGFSLEEYGKLKNPLIKSRARQRAFIYITEGMTTHEMREAEKILSGDADNANIYLITLEKEGYAYRKPETAGKRGLMEFGLTVKGNEKFSKLEKDPIFLHSRKLVNETKLQGSLWKAYGKWEKEHELCRRIRENPTPRELKKIMGRKPKYIRFVSR